MDASFDSTRRSFLRLGGLGGLSLFHADWLRAAAAAPSRRAKAKSVILVFNCGGPSHLDLWDPKPDAPEDIRGTFRPIATNVSGIRVSELLPRTAKLADRYSIIRSVHHHHQGHNSAMYWSIVGRPYPIDSTLINPSRTDMPSLGTLVGWLAERDHYSGALPPYVITPSPHCDSTAYITPGQYGGCLGPKHDPFVLNSDPNSADFKVRDIDLVEGIPAKRLEERQDLLRTIDANSLPIDTPTAREIDIYQAKALSLVSSGEMQKAFDLSREPAKVRERYGRHTWGQSHLLARRLVEAGVPFVTTVNGQSIVWDTHKDNFHSLEKRLVPPMETAFAALLQDLEERGLLESTVVVWLGDFGRTPKINSDAGRDHWPPCYSVVMAGGGLRGGQVVGESDRTGAYPVSRALSPADVHATVFAALGYDPHAVTYP
ncbi:MAG TPA: DUF1501 domain-containing protein, partial [Planctomycetota bacterium]|nr:DUF1501 domain-containing protein [Planctomycetota bacterium]